MTGNNDNFRLERMDPETLTVRATCRGCGISFVMDLHKENFKERLSDHRQAYPGKPTDPSRRDTENEG